MPKRAMLSVGANCFSEKLVMMKMLPWPATNENPPSPRIWVSNSATRFEETRDGPCCPCEPTTVTGEEVKSASLSRMDSMATGAGVEAQVRTSSAILRGELRKLTQNIREADSLRGFCPVWVYHPVHSGGVNKERDSNKARCGQIPDVLRDKSPS